MKPFEIFRTGTHTSSNGITKDYSLDDLEQIADNYNRSEHEAPIVIGHPKSNAPAFGWIKKIFVEGDRLFAEAKDLAEDFVNAVKEKKFLKRSISLTKDGLLNHVGFLGATVPAVKGLADVEFNEDQELTEFEFDEEMLEEEIGQDKDADETQTKDENFSKSEEDETKNKNEMKLYFENLSNTLTTVISDFKDVISKHSDSNLQFMEENKEELSKLENKMSDLRAKIDVANFEMMLTERVAYGNLTPAMKEKMVDLLNYFETLNFAETSQNEISSSIQNLLTEFVNSIPKIVQFEEVATLEETETETKDDTFDDFDLDPDSAALHSEIIKTMKKDEITYEEAFHKVINEKK
ncbi:MAG: hypothetical protein QY331_07585 [Melioribacteraceae bacterium]|nr:MAG: hypothetical protein QY331_07585 [Melioribacteraceae bacterium]